MFLLRFPHSSYFSVQTHGGPVSRPSPRGSPGPHPGCVYPSMLWGRPPRTATAAGGTNPPGMYSFWYLLFVGSKIVPTYAKYTLIYQAYFFNYFLIINFSNAIFIKLQQQDSPLSWHLGLWRACFCDGFNLCGCESTLDLAHDEIPGLELGGMSYLQYVVW